MIERDPELVGRIQAQLDVLVVEGADLLLAVTNIDEVNLIACLVAAQFEVPQKVARVSNPE